MAGVQIHLVFNHFPLVFAFIGLIILGYGVFRRSSILIKAGLLINLGAFFFTLPMFFSGEAAEEAVEQMQHVSSDFIHKHEEMAEKAFAFSFVLAIVSAAAFFGFPAKFSGSLPKVALVISFVAFFLYALTAHWGGRISHPELREVKVGEKLK